MNGIEVRGNDYLQYKKFADNLMDVVLIIDKNGKILYGNKKALETYGYTYEELVKLTIFDLRRHDPVKFVRQQLNEALHKGIEFVAFHCRKDGSSFPVEVKSIHSPEKSENRVTSIIRVISHIEEIHRDAKIFFSASLDIFSEAIIGFAKDYKITLWSKGAEGKFGYKKGEILGKNLKLLVPSDKLRDYEEKINLVKKGQIIENFETACLHKNGDVVDVSLSIAPVYDSKGLFIGAVGVYQTISEKRRLDQKSNEYEERWRLALEGGRFGVWDWKINANEVLCTDLFRTMLGYPADEEFDTFEKFIGKVHPDDAPYVAERLQKHFHQGEAYDVEFRMRTQSGEYKWIRTKGKVSEWTDEGKPLRMVGIHEDINERKIIEQELKEKYKLLELLKQEAENANKAKSLFLANMSHEIKTPMNGIVGVIQLLQLTDCSAEQEKYLKMLKESADTLLEMINDILDISKIEAGALQIGSEPFDLKETITGIYNNLLVMGKTKGLEIDFYLDPNIEFQVIGDELKLKQIITNLISNAVKFTERGYVSFQVKLIAAGESRQKIEFTVKDSGIGIEDSIKQKIFCNFFQGDLSINKKYQGTGLGLAIAKQLALAMNGDICFESTLGQGSTFRFICEFAKMRASKENKGQEEKAVIGKRRQEKVVLCVEDNLINQEVMAGLLKSKGYHYIAAYSGKEALEILKNKKIDLILMDIQMPDLNGFETTKLIRQRKDRMRDIPIIAMTVYARREDREKCIRAGMNDYIAKPFDLEGLYRLLDSYLKIEV